jgi:hypothetical protein
MRRSVIHSSKGRPVRSRTTVVRCPRGVPERSGNVSRGDRLAERRLDLVEDPLHQRIGRTRGRRGRQPGSRDQDLSKESGHDLARPETVRMGEFLGQLGQPH